MFYYLYVVSVLGIPWVSFNSYSESFQLCQFFRVPGPPDTLIFCRSEPPLPEIVETAPEDRDLYSCLSSVLAAEKSPRRWNLTFSSPPLLM